jgi:hypothetical protein
METRDNKEREIGGKNRVKGGEKSFSELSFCDDNAVSVGRVREKNATVG